MLTAQNLNFHYDSRQVLYNINVELPAGSITGLIGPNGAGKSTLMRCMAGLECPSSGEVLLGGKPILANPRASFAQLGYLPDIFGLPEGLSVIQCLTYAAKSRGVSDGDLAQAVGSTVQLLGLADKLYSRVSNLSRGQKQRVGIGQVIIHRPKFLLLDEPASGLDPEARHELSLLLLQLQREGMTILVSSHILSELDEYCSHMLVIKQGQIQAFQALHGEAQPATQTVRLRFAERTAAELEAAVRELAHPPAHAAPHPGAGGGGAGGGGARVGGGAIGRSHRRCLARCLACGQFGVRGFTARFGAARIACVCAGTGAHIVVGKLSKHVEYSKG